MASGSVCKNHPQRKTSRHCFQCRASICHPCTVHLDRHYFCSPACHVQWFAEPTPKRMPKKQRVKARRRKAERSSQREALPRTDSPRVDSPESQTGPTQSEASLAAAIVVAEAVPAPAPIPERPRAPIIFKHAAPTGGRLRWAALFTFNVIAVIFLSMQLTQERKLPEETGVAHLQSPRADYGVTGVIIPAPTLSAPASTTAAAIAVRGSAPGAVTVAVLLNGREAGTLLRDGDSFRTAELPLVSGVNVIQVRAQAAGEAAPRYSLAHIVHRGPKSSPGETARPLLLPPASRFREISRGDPDRQAVSFTFDGGSEANAAGEILDTLREHKVVTTLFLTGEFIRKYPEIVRQAAHDGHEIGNHTDTHPHLTSYNQSQRHTLLPHVTESFFKKQLADTEAAYQAVAGKPMAPYWRAPYGEVNAQLQDWAGDLGYQHVGWTRRVGPVSTLDSLDWVNDTDSHLYLSGTQLKKRFVGLVHEDVEAVQGGIFLMHLGTQRKTDKIHWQLAEILTAYREAGFQILPVSQLAR